MLDDRQRYIIQYSIPTKNKIAVSDWQEKEALIEAKSGKEAINKFNKTYQHLGSWLILDCCKA